MNNSIFKKLFVACCLALITLPAMGQKAKNALWDAFDAFTGKVIKERKTTMVVSRNFADGYIQEYRFKTVATDVQKFDETMLDNTQLAYDSYVKAEGVDVQGSSYISLSYGENNKESYQVTYERNGNYNVQLVRDPKDKTKRYAYVLAWKKDGDKVSGIVVKVYGKDPRVPNSPTEVEKPTSSQEFMQSFSNLRALFVKQNDEMRSDLNFGRAFQRTTSDKLPLLTGVANKIAALCSNYGNLLNSADYQLVRQTLQELQKTSADKYVGNLLGACYDNLGNVKPKP